MTGRLSVDQMPDEEIDGYINTYYLYDFPENLRILNTQTFLTFNVQPNVDTYAVDMNKYINLQPPGYIAGYQILWYQSPEAFYRVWPKLDLISQVSSGNGGTHYQGQISAVPILKNSVIITANNSFSTALTMTDNGLGFFTGDVAAAPPSTIDYKTGIFDIYFSATIPAGVAINAESFSYVASRPTDVLFWEGDLVFRPVPDIAYQFQIFAWQQPTAFLSTAPAATTPIQDWWQLLAYGAALKIFVDNADFDQYQKFYPLYDEQLRLVQRKSLVQITNQRATSIYSDQGLFPYGNFRPLF